MECTKPVNETITLDTYPDMFLDYDCNVENENYDHQIRLFTVPLNWAVEWMRSECKLTLDEFMKVYTWDETMQMYEDARSENALCATKIVEQ